MEGTGLPLTGGKAGSFAGGWFICPGSGAGNAPCAAARSAEAAREAKTASVSGTIKRRMIKAVSPAEPNVPTCFLMQARMCQMVTFYDSCLALTTRGIWQERGAAPHLWPIFCL